MASFLGIVTMSFAFVIGFYPHVHWTNSVFLRTIWAAIIALPSLIVSHEWLLSSGEFQDQADNLRNYRY
jgi:vacuolar-type H+-ATPase subunit I/STV1